jgi:hypothetical protein
MYGVRMNAAGAGGSLMVGITKVDHLPPLDIELSKEI